MNDSLGDRMKLYESAEAGRRLMPLAPALARLDGRAFHSFVRGLDRPYDERLSRLMIETARFLVQETIATVGYTQSDEITLAWVPTDFESQVFFDGRIQKMTSVLASLGSAYFNRRLPEFLPPEYAVRLPLFDARIWNVPNLDEAANTFLWRETDATKNSISMAARAYYNHTELHEKSGSEMQEMLFQKGVNWNDYPAFFKRGTYLRRETIRKPFTVTEVEDLPPKHAARTNANLVVERSVVTSENLPPLAKLVNRSGVLFASEPPRLKATVDEGMLGR